MLYKVSVEKVQVYPHPNADLLDLVGIGEQQYVVEKGLYKTGDKGVAVPKKSVLTHALLLQEWQKYLQGPNKNRVGSIVLRGQESEGIVIRDNILSQLGYNINDFQIGQDISTLLGISKYIPTIPEELKNSVELVKEDLIRLMEHDCKYASVYLSKFNEGDTVTITSKIHGTQANYICLPDKNVIISSKGLLDQGLVFKQDTNNIYYQAWHNTFDDSTTNALFWNTLSDIINNNALAQEVQIIGEVVPAISGFSYGFTKPTLYIYSIYVNGRYIDLTQFRTLPNIYVVPELYRGPFDSITTLEIANNFAQQAICPLDGKTLNEGVVISNGRHYIKVKNDKFMKKHGKEEGN